MFGGPPAYLMADAQAQYMVGQPGLDLSVLQAAAAAHVPQQEMQAHLQVMPCMLQNTLIDFSMDTAVSRPQPGLLPQFSYTRSYAKSAQDLHCNCAELLFCSRSLTEKGKTG